MVGGMPTIMMDTNLATLLTSITRAIIGMNLPLALMFLATQKQNTPKASQNIDRHRSSLSTEAAIVVVAPGSDAAPPAKSPIPVISETINII